MKATVADPSRLDLRRLADTGQTIDGRWSGDSMTRLAQDTTEAPGEVGWSARAEWRPVAGAEPELWLHLRCESSVQLTCQRCLKAIGVDLPVDRWFRFVRDEAEAERLDELGDDDVLALGGPLDLHALAEDELILAMPLVPMHERCPDPLPMPTAEPLPEAPADHPFQALAALKRKRPEPN